MRKQFGTDGNDCDLLDPATAFKSRFVFQSAWRSSRSLSIRHHQVSLFLFYNDNLNKTGSN